MVLLRPLGDGIENCGRRRLEWWSFHVESVDPGWNCELSIGNLRRFSRIRPFPELPICSGHPLHSAL